MTASDIFAGLSRGGLLSPTGSCKTWDQTADGYCRADAVGVVVLKRLKSAVHDRDNVLAILQSTATSHSPQASSITHPHAQSQARLMQAVLNEAGIRADEVGYVEMHGTGTQAGDMAEVSAVNTIFGGHRSSEKPLYIGTVKPNIGHSEAASGVSSVIKAIVMFRESRIPPHIGIKTTMNRNLPDLVVSDILIPFTEKPFPADTVEDGARHILVNNFNITSGNTSMLLKDGFKPVSEGRDLRSAHIITISAHSEASLQGNLRRLENHLSQNAGISLPDLSYSTTARRMHHSLRHCYVVKEVPDLLAAIRKDILKANPPVPTSQSSQVIFLFDGQGSQYAGMGEKLFKECSTFRKSILNSERICQSLGMSSFVKLITDSHVDLAEIDDLQSMLALIALEVALAELWRSWGLEPVMFVGHSLGEYTALYLAGVYSLTDMFYLIGRRYSLIRKTCNNRSYRMLSVNMSVEGLKCMFQDLSLLDCELVCYNAVISNVVGGPIDQIEKLERQMVQNHIKTTLLQLTYASHSAQMDPILEDLRNVANQIPFRRPRIPIASTVKSNIVEKEGTFNADYIVEHSRRPVNFVQTIQGLKKQGKIGKKTLWVEIGPSSSLLSMTRSILSTPSSERYLCSLRQKNDEWGTLLTSLAKAYNAGIDIKWQEYHHEYEAALHLLKLPSYSFDLKSYWIQYEGDWCVRKAHVSSGPAAASPLPSIESMTLQRIDSEIFGDDEAILEFVSDFQEGSLKAAIVGHMVGELALCPSSIYADIAITAASYIWKHIRPAEHAAVFDVANMNVRKPLIIKPSAESQMIKISARKESGLDNIKMFVYSREGDVEVHYADWIVVPGDSQRWIQAWAKQAYLYRARIASLQHRDSSNRVHHLLGSMVYKLFSVLVVYGIQYQGIQEVFMDGNSYEATARVSFPSDSYSIKSVCNPYWIDSLAHISGFVLNGSVRTPQDTVFVSHGWDSMRFAQPLSKDHSYQTHVKMEQSGRNGFMTGDLYVLCEDVLVAAIIGLRFQAVKNVLLKNLLTKHNTRTSVEDPPPLQGPHRRRPTVAGESSIPQVPLLSGNEAKATALIATELAIEPALLGDDVNLASIGLDSLLVIEIQAKLQSKLGLRVPSSLFVNHSTMGDVRRYLAKTETNNPTKTVSRIRSDDDDHGSKSVTPEPSLTAWVNQKTDELRNVIAKELGVSANDIEPHANLLDLGIDSMLTLSIVNSVRLKTGQNIPANFFILYPTFSDIQGFYQGVTRPTTPKSSVVQHPQMAIQRNPSSQPVEPAILASPPLEAVKSPLSSKRSPKCSATLLQFPSNLTVNSPTLILLPDGAGSPAPYTRLPTLHSALRIIGLTSPFLTNPVEYTISLPEISAIYSATIMDAAPIGALILGGVSIGGIYAYEVAKQLLEKGRGVTGILFLDSPCPQRVPAIEPNQLLEVLDVLDSLGTFQRSGRNDSKLASNAREHFIRTAMALEQYRPHPFNAAIKRLSCEAIWANRGILESLSKEHQAAIEASFRGTSLERDWLMKRMMTTGPQGWEDLFDQVRCEEIDANHFSLFKGEHVGALLLA